MKQTTIKRLIIGVALATQLQSVKAQWLNNGTNIYNSNTGNVGIGTSTPTQKFHLSAGNLMLDYVSSGSVGNLYLGGRPDGFQNGMRLWSASTGYSSIDVRANETNGGLAFRVDPTNGGTERMKILANGRVGIGVSIPLATLAVSGDMMITHNVTTDYALATQILVNRDLTKALAVFDKNLNEVFTIWGNGVVNSKKVYAEAFEVLPNAMGISWYDHVFSKDYKLPALKTVEQYIKLNSHLPGIPSENEINKNGFSLVEMDGLLCKKVRKAKNSL